MGKAANKSKLAQRNAYVTLDKRTKNRDARLARHAKKHPNDLQAQKAPAVKANKVKAHVKGNFPTPSCKLRDPITGQPINDVSYADWDDSRYDPIPPKKGRKNAKTS